MKLLNRRNTPKKDYVIEQNVVEFNNSEVSIKGEYSRI